MAGPRTVIRFQLDEHMPHAIAQALVLQGIDIVTADEAGTVGMPDDDLLRRCLAESRVIVTNDKGFLRLHHRGVPHAGIVYCRHGSRTIREMIDFLALVAGILDSSQIAGRVEFVT